MVHCGIFLKNCGEMGLFSQQWYNSENAVKIKISCRKHNYSWFVTQKVLGLYLCVCVCPVCCCNLLKTSGVSWPSSNYHNFKFEFEFRKSKQIRKLWAFNPSRIRGSNKVILLLATSICQTIHLGIFGPVRPLWHCRTGASFNSSPPSAAYASVNQVSESGQHCFR